MPRISFAAAALAGALALSAHPASADVKSQDDSGFVTNDTRVVDATPREVWLALISPGKWWNSSHTWSGDAENMTITPQAGGCFCERIPAVDSRDTIGLAGSAHHMTVVQSSPDKVLRMRGGLGPLQSEPVDGVLTITIGEMEDEGSRVTFEYVVGGYMRFEVPVISKAVDGVMTQQLEGLASFLGKLDDPEAEETAEDAAAADEEEGIEEIELPESDTDGETAEDSDTDAAEEPEAPRISVDDAFGDLTEDE